MAAPFQTVEKPLRGFSTILLQSAARTRCAPYGHNAHTGSLRSIFGQVHAPAENEFRVSLRQGAQTLRGFFDTLKRSGMAAPFLRIQNR